MALQKLKKINKVKKSTWLLAVFLCAATLFRLVLSGALMIYFIPGTQYDDLMQMLKAMAVVDGYWLGGYGPLTLVKGIGYPLLTAVFSWLGIPYILGYHMLYVGACIVFAAAMRPLFQRRWMWALGYVALLFNPVAFSTQITKLYRDIAYYSLALLVVGAALGFLLRYDAKWGGLGYGLLCGFALALAAGTREDSQWLYIYVAACVLVYGVLRGLQWRKEHGKIQWRRLVAVPLLLVVGWGLYMLPVCGANYAYYGTFTTDEYTSGPFAEAYGALSRLNGDAEDPHVVIPEAQRRQLYTLSPAFAELEEVLDGEDSLFAAWREAQGEYRAGYFSFILREAAAAIGKYESAATANAYFAQLAHEVNEVCDTGLMAAGPRRSGITARFYAWMLPDIADATVQGMWMTLNCHGISPVPVPVEADDAYLVKFEGYVHDTIAADRYMENGETVANYHYTGGRLSLLWVARAVVGAWRYVLPVLFLAALAAFVATPVWAVAKKRAQMRFWAGWIAAGSLLCAFVLRSAMIGFVHVSSFQAIDNPAYQAAGYGMALGFIVLAAGVAVNMVWPKRREQDGARAVLDAEK